MFIESHLMCGVIRVSSPTETIANELLVVFRDDMLQIKEVTEEEFFRPVLESRYSEIEYEDDEADEERFEMFEFRSPGQHVAARLDVMGITPQVVYEYLEQQLRIEEYHRSDDHLSTLDGGEREWAERDRALRRSLNGQDWVKRLASTSGGEREEHPRQPNIGGRNWLLRELYSMDDRFALRAVLLSFPDSEVVLQVHDIGGKADEARRKISPASAASTMAVATGMHSPVVVLTEGRTDAEFLSSGLKILYPYLTDLIRFMDYGQKAEGGAGTLVRMIRAFAAAGIANRIIAIFDNDTAATDAMRALDISRLPPQIKVIRYPTLPMAANYPTLGPPSRDAPEGSATLADVNGSAGSIELYLGKDVLAGKSGELRPVQWKSYIPAVGRYQGEVIDKDGIQESFRKKCELASGMPEVVRKQDWEGVRLIIDAICDAAQSAFGTNDPIKGL